MYNNINDLMNLALQNEFCKEVGVDDLDIYNGRVIALNYECTESYYGHMLIQPVAVGEYSIEEIQRWIDNQYELEKFHEEQSKDYDDYLDNILPDIIEQEELDRLHDEWMMEELAWYNKARQMGWE